ncbi:MAG: DNA topoisomerase IV subunit A [Firmicutes bacterium]|nr:DNA topoisomerase IV subunit A [Bacillota bacterium]
MAKKKEETIEILGRIYDYTLEEIMGDRFGQYAKDIIQNRAIPDVRDGLKPVQRRILYAMFRDKNTFDKAHKKSATAVGNVMGHYHPHGDSSIYEAMVHMSQWWKQNECYIDMHGNNGSMDGDSAAAMRYTEARLSKISGELLKDIDKDTIEWAPNFDDTLYEPIVLPAKYPNLLVNGAKGISAGYATEIPPHNLGEVIDATIKRIDSPNCRLDTILDIVKGPDFPTGAIVEGKEQIEEALTKGRGKVIIRSKYEIVEDKKSKQVIIHEIPFEVNKANLVKKISDIIYDKKIDGMIEIRDESDREEKVRIAIDLKKDADVDNILNYLFKNTDLQISYSYNMVAIVNRRPMIVGIIEVLDAYIAHQKEVITRRTKFDLEHAKSRMHIVEGLIKALDILDEVIKTIRASKNKSDAIKNLVEKYEFSDKQAEAIVNLQLYRLTNTDVNVLKEEHANLLKVIQILESILSDEEKLKTVMKKELKAIKDEYATPRKTEIKDEITEIKIDTTAMIPKEDCIVVVTKDGYVKRVSKRSYGASSEDKTGLKDQDYVIGMYELNTMDTILMFTDIGNYLFVPVHEIPDMKWKDLGKHISNIIKINPDENIIDSIPVIDFKTDKYITVFTKNGMIKRTLISDLKALRYTKPMPYIKLKDGDMVANISYNNGTDVFITTHNGFGLKFDINEIPILGSRASGVKGISLKNDVVANGSVISDEEYITLVTTKNTGKRVKISEFERISRARKGIQVIRDVKTNPYYILKSFVINSRHNIGLKFKEDIEIIKLTELPIADRHSTGTSLSKHDIFDVFIEKTLENPKEVKKADIESKEIIKENISLESIDKRMMTIDDFLGDLDLKG